MNQKNAVNKAQVDAGDDKFCDFVLFEVAKLNEVL